MMNRSERIAYAQMHLSHEFERIGLVHFFSERKWQSEFLANPDVDPTGAHKKYGLTAPQYVKEQWWVGVCPNLLVDWVDGEDDETLERWLEYWLVHLGMHLIVLDWAQNLGDTGLALDQIEARVEDLFQEQGPDLFAMGAEMKRKTITLRTHYG